MPNPRDTYIPPDVQKAVAAHMDRAMPAHLQKYQGKGAFTPEHAERAMVGHLQKTLPSHLKQYADSYVQQNVIFGANQPSGAAQQRVSPATPYRTPYIPGQHLHSSGPSRPASERPKRSVEPDNSAAGASTPPSDGYDFIFSPPAEPKKPTLSLPGGNSMIGRAILFGGGLIVMVMLAVIGFSLINSSANAQNQKLIDLAQSQTEILRVSDETGDNITDAKLAQLIATTQTSVTSSRTDVVSLLAKRGKKAGDKELRQGGDPKTDAALAGAEQSGNFQAEYKKILEKQLDNYVVRLHVAYESASPGEKQTLSQIFGQVEILRKDLKAIK